MKLNANLSDINPRELARSVLRYRGTFITLLIIGLLGYAGYQISRITGVQPDQAYLAQQQKNHRTAAKLKVNKDVITGLKQLQSSGDTTVPINPGKHDPFSLD